MSFSPQLPATHTALVQTAYAQPPSIQNVPTPTCTPGSVLVKIIAAPVVSYTKDILDGTRGYPYPTPIVPGPGAIGRIAALGHDATSLTIGHLVAIDTMVRSRDNPADVLLLGLTHGAGACAAKLMTDVWRNGTYAEYALVPLENCIALDEEKLLSGLKYTESDLALLGQYLVPYGGLRDIELRVGETIVIAPATGAFGGAAVAVALAMGAARVVAMGRSVEKLKRLVEHFGEERVKTVTIADDVVLDTASLKEAAGGPIDAVFDISPPAATGSTHIKSAMLSLRLGGRFSFMGGILQDHAIPLNVVMRNNITLKGKWMYERADVVDMVRMIDSGILKIGRNGGVKIAGEFGLDEWEEAIETASREAGWNSGVVFRIGK